MCHKFKSLILVLLGLKAHELIELLQIILIGITVLGIKNNFFVLILCNKIVEGFISLIIVALILMLIDFNKLSQPFLIIIAKDKGVDVIMIRNAFTDKTLVPFAIIGNGVSNVNGIVEFKRLLEELLVKLHLLIGDLRVGHITTVLV